MVSEVFIRKRVAPMQGKPKNYLCYFVEADRIWADFIQWCDDFNFPKDSKESFLECLQKAVPALEVVNRQGEFRFYNLMYQPDGVE